MTNPLDSPVSIGTALLIAERIFQMIRFRNGSSRRVTEDRIKVIISESLQPIYTRINTLAEGMSALRERTDNHSRGHSAGK